MISLRKLALGAGALVVLSPLVATAAEPTYKNHGQCVSDTAKGGEARSAAARSDCGKDGEVTPPPPGTGPTEVRIADPDIQRTDTLDPLKYLFFGGGWAIVNGESRTAVWTWNFGDGTASEPFVGTHPPFNLTHTYASPGVKTATLTITEPVSGLSDSWATTWTADATTPLYSYYPGGAPAGGYDVSEPDGIDRVRRLPFQPDL